MAKIKVYSSDFLKNAGIVGFCNIIEYSEERQGTIFKGKNYIEFDESCLEKFQDKYFTYLVDKYLVFTSWYKLTSYEEKLQKYMSSINDKELEDFNIYIEDFKKKLTSNSYKAAYPYIDTSEYDPIENEKFIKKIKKTTKQDISDVKGEIDNQIQLCLKMIEFLRKPDSKKYITAKNVAYDIVQMFWGNVCFLSKNNSNKDMYKEYSIKYS